MIVVRVRHDCCVVVCAGDGAAVLWVVLLVVERVMVSLFVGCGFSSSDARSTVLFFQRILPVRHAGTEWFLFGVCVLVGLFWLGLGFSRPVLC